MYKIDDYVMYSTTGVCKITDIKQGKLFNDVETRYYVLCPVFDNNPSSIRVSVDNKKVKMRKILSENDVVSLIDNFPSVETQWINDSKLRGAKHKEYLLSGKCEDWILLFKTLQTKKTEKNQINKALSPTDEATMKSAEKLLFQEFSIALNIPVDDVEKYIKKRAAQAV
ncbi:MAG: CarD family transcriptional regulator [Eubacteriales bacterium]|nr:CarD family transcriptional regulator [Eubacteriales bacterium]